MNPVYQRSLRRHYGRLGLALFLYMVVTVAAETVFQYVVVWLRPEFMASGWYMTVLSFVPMYLVGFPVFLTVLPPPAPAELARPKGKLSLKQLFLLLLMCLGCLYPGNLIGQGLNAGLNLIFRTSGTNGLETLAGGSDLLPYTLMAVVLGPIMEEITFRKLLIDRMCAIDKPSAVCFSALAFGLFHGNVVQFFYAFGIGLIFGAVYVRTGRLWHTILLHMAVNFFGSLAAMVLLPRIDLLDPLNALLPLLLLGAYCLLLLTGAIAGVVLLVRRWKELRVGDGADRLAGMRFSTAFCTLGFGLYLLTSLAVTGMAYR